YLLGINDERAWGACITRCENDYALAVELDQVGVMSVAVAADIFRKINQTEDLNEWRAGMCELCKLVSYRNDQVARIHALYSRKAVVDRQDGRFYGTEITARPWRLC